MSEELLTEETIQEDSIEKRGRLITCKYCKEKFQFYDEDEKSNWKKSKYPCPICGEIYCILPPTEKELRLLQEDYSKTKSKKTFNQMIRLFYSYTESLIKKHFSNRLTFEDALEYYTHNSVTKFVEYYLKNEDFTVDISFAGLLMHKIKETIFNKQEKPSAPVSLDFEFEDGNTVEYEDTKKSELDRIEEDENKKALCKYLCELMFGIKKYCPDNHTNYIRTIAVTSYIEKGSKYFDKLFQLYGSEGKLITLRSLDILRDALIKSESF